MAGIYGNNIILNEFGNPEKKERKKILKDISGTCEAVIRKLIFPNKQRVMVSTNDYLASSIKSKAFIKGESKTLYITLVSKGGVSPSYGMSTSGNFGYGVSIDLEAIAEYNMQIKEMGLFFKNEKNCKKFETEINKYSSLKIKFKNFDQSKKCIILEIIE